MHSTADDNGRTPDRNEDDAPDFGRPRRSRAKCLDPEAEAVLGMLSLVKRKSVDHANLHRHRLLWQLSATALGRSTAVMQVETRNVPGPGGPIRLRVYRPSAAVAAAPALVWFHGGGFLMGGLATADAICRHIAVASGAVVIAVRYRLVPEHDLYAGRADCLAAMDWIVSEGHTLGIDSTRLAVGGDSAGGNLAAAVAQRHAARGERALRLQVLAYPATNLLDDFPSQSENASGYLLTEEGIDAIRMLIAKEELDLSDPWISPAFSRDLRRLPPALVLAAGFDPIRDDGLAYACRLREAGVPVQLLHYAGQFHGFLNFNGVLRAARDALDRIGAALRRALDVRDDEPPARIDRTIELSAQVRRAPAWPVLRMNRNLLISALMVGERLEGWRVNLARRTLPGNAWVDAFAAVPWLNPMTCYRAALAQQFAPLMERETWRGSADESPRAD